jgi:hypothetical protein
VLTWVRAQGAPTVGAYGISLGGYVTALLAAVEPGLALAIAAVPATDLPALFAHHAPPWLRRRALEHHLLGEDVNRLHRVVSPLAMQPQVPRRGRFIIGGLGDRMSTPKQAYRLWHHWDRPEMAWYGGNHVGFFWSREADRFVIDALVTSGFTASGATGGTFDPPGTEAESGSRRRGRG